MSSTKLWIRAMLVTAMVCAVSFETTQAKDTNAKYVGISERQLRDLSEAVHHAKSASSGIAHECQRDSGSDIGGINYIGTSIPPLVPDFGGDVPLPPRPKYLTLHLAQLNGAMPLLHEEIENLKAPDATVAAKLAPFMDEIKSVWKDALKQSTALAPLCTTPPFNAKEIISTANALNQDLDSIERLKNEMYKASKKADVINIETPQAQP